MSGSRRGEAGQVALDVLDSLLEGCQVVDPEWRYRFVNTTVARQAGKSSGELLGRTMMECFPGIDSTAMFAALRQCMTERRHHRMENEFVYPDGSRKWFELHFVPVPEGMCVLSVDVTDRKHAQAELARTAEQLRHAQKMEAVGRLAGGVAHDFNNLLSIILSYATLAREGDSTDLRADLLEIERAAQRAAELTRQLLTFSRKQVVTPRVLDVNETLAGMDAMLRRLVGVDVDLRLTTGSRGNILADAGQIQQVIMNLAVNARDAMPAGGKLTIESADVDLDEAYARTHLNTTPGPHVMIAVSDTGVGMDKATQEHLFEPFFTTKPPGHGTGLGLSIVFGIVQQRGGSIWVYSEPGIGTTFKLYFPRAIGAPEPVSVAVPEARPSAGKETILLVEDDDQLRKVARTILQRAGYEVVDAAHPEKAFEAVQVGEVVPDLLVTDLVLPQMSGHELAEKLRASRPGTKVLFMSGYAGDAVVHRGMLNQDVPFLGKPFTPKAFVAAVRAALDERQGPSRPG